MAARYPNSSSNLAAYPESAARAPNGWLFIFFASASRRHWRWPIRSDAFARTFATAQRALICRNRRLARSVPTLNRDPTRLCVVEQPRDLMSLEQSGVFKGVYHVLLGRIAPLDGIGPDQLTIDALVERVRTGNFVEIIMATNPTVEGDGTSLYVSNLLSEFPVEITRLARGITAGSVLEYANREMIADALTGRQKL